MLLVQRGSMLAFNIHDGMLKKKRGEKLNELQLNEAVRLVHMIVIHNV